MYYFYIAKNKHQKLYVGSTSNLTNRLKRHNLGYGAKYTSVLKSYDIVYSEKFLTLQESRSREAQIKKWSRKKKLALIENKLDNLVQYSKSK
jgi:putative endonuclease